MENFNQLLNEYIQRAGISDSELARTIGVSRQTIFRWREGLTSRPRHRDDVLVIAKKLRLTPEERDKLLLTAGFRPEAVEDLLPQSSDEGDAAPPESADIDRSDEPEAGVATVEVEAPTLSTPVPATQHAEPEPIIQSQPKEIRRVINQPLVVGGLIGVVILATVIFGGLWTDNPPPPTPIPTQREVILIPRFVSSAENPIDDTLNEQVAEQLQSELAEFEWLDAEIDTWAEPIGLQEDALQLGQSRGATLVMYGAQDDTGQIVIEFAQPAAPETFANPTLRQHIVQAQGVTVDDEQFVAQLSALSLIGLGQRLLHQKQPDQAISLFNEVNDSIMDDLTLNNKSHALNQFHLGIAHQSATPPALNQAIAAYDDAIKLWPEMVSSRLNRSAAYTARNQAGDLALALADAEAVLDTHPNWAAAYNNRASILLTTGGERNLTLALADLEQALVLNPDLPEAYLNRAYVHFAQGWTIEDVREDVKQAFKLRPDYGYAFSFLCWGYGLENRPKSALSHCEQALKLQPNEPLFQDSYGLALALQGDYDAAIDNFEAYAAWLKATPETQDRKRDLDRREAWIDALERGENPFTSEILNILRREVGK